MNFPYCFDYPRIIKLKEHKIQGIPAVLAALAQESSLSAIRLLAQTGPQGLAASKIAARRGMTLSPLSCHLKEPTARAWWYLARTAGSSSTAPIGDDE